MSRYGGLQRGCLAVLLPAMISSVVHQVAEAGDAGVKDKCAATASLESGVKFSSEPARSLLLKPKTTLNCGRGGQSLEMKSSAVADYRISDGAWGESTADWSLSYETPLGGDTKLTFDADYGFERTLDENAADQRLTLDDHSIEASAGLEWEWEPLSFKLDAGASSELHAPTGRSDGQSFDRHAEDYAEPEISLRIAAGPEDAWQPFVEVAYVARRYFSDSSLAGVHRHMAGPQFIVGVQTERHHFEGQIAAIQLVRDYAEDGVASPPVIGPYIDITWRPDSRTEIIFAAVAAIDQDTTGDIRGDPFYSAKLDVSYRAAEHLKVQGSAAIEFDDDPGRGGTLTITPELKFTWNIRENTAFLAGLGASWERDGDGEKTLSATVLAGWSVKW